MEKQSLEFSFCVLNSYFCIYHRWRPAPYMPIFHCLAVLFDLDGVLVDSTRSVSRQWRRWAGEHRLDPERVLAIAHGVRTIEVVQQLAPHLDLEAEVRRIEQREAEDTDGVAVMPGAADLVRSIPDGRWCVVTSGTRLLATARLRLGGLPTPRVLITADDVTNGKPAPEPYLKGAELLGVKPAECLVIEDAPAGIRAAHASGMKAIALASTYPGSELKEADIVVRSLKSVAIGAAAERLEVHITREEMEAAR
jgi:sugar-phosphatase